MQNYEIGGDNKIKSFTDLNAHKEAHKLVLLIYEITKGFPKEERFCLIDQIRRAAVSIVSNIAEGFSRNTTKDKCKFYSLALGSLSELQSQLLIAKDLKYLNQQIFNQIAQQSIVVRKLISGLKRIKYQNEKI
ncbi:MAG: four helix bundle protein [Candidatus Pacebacteria bacterium]|nr:four helix bundle protein [Candidatus Paceibacterota bacterium]